MKRVFLGALAIAIPLLSSFPLAAQSDSVLMQQLRQCREYSDVQKRVTCYDRIGEPASVAVTPSVPANTQTAATEVAAADVPQEVERVSQDPEPTDDFGLPKSEDDLNTIHATVVRCGEANNHRFYFYFDNGQVWKYLGGKKLRYRTCKFPATLTEDSFGFALRIDGKSSLRVRRVK